MSQRKKEKVYCKDCEFLHRWGNINKYYCQHHCSVKTVNTWLEQKSVSIHPSMLNQKNNCKHFRKKAGFRTLGVNQ